MVKVWRVEHNKVARTERSRAVIATAAHLVLLHCSQRIHPHYQSLNKDDRLISPDVPASLVTPTVNPDSIRIKLIGSATSRNLSRRQNQNRVKKVKQERRLSSQERCFEVLKAGTRGTISAPPSCRSPLALSSPLKDSPQW